ncbi:MAG: histidine phosphatase family protein [Asgard group archaeon]|nr:histidine phosphatase family protein [Asgard group archaeon]
MSKSIPNPTDIRESRVSDSDRTEYAKLYNKHIDEQPFHWEFSVVPGMFKQSSSQTDETTFDTVKSHFGVIPTWDEVVETLNSLNENSNSDEVQYKLFILARHGQGVHNLKYNEDPVAWDAKWNRLYTDGVSTWGPDPQLTELGIEQALDNNKTWKQELVNNKHNNKDLIKPTRFFSSPFSRSIDTLFNTWKDIVDLKEVKPLIQEQWRETIGMSTCDQRSPRSVIAKRYEDLGFVIEPGFAEEDIYWTPDHRETVAELALRQHKGFEEIFNNHTNDKIVNITSHSNAIRAQLVALGHRQFAISTGGTIPVFVKAVKVK